MINPAHRIYVHVAWTTLDRRPMIDHPTRLFLDRFFRKVAIAEKVEVVTLAILQTHVHAIFRLPTRFDLSRLMQQLKGGSSYEASRLEGNRVGLRWSREYSADSISPRALPRAIAYVATQDRHHPTEAIAAAARQRSASPSTRFSV